MRFGFQGLGFQGQGSDDRGAGLVSRRYEIKGLLLRHRNVQPSIPTPEASSRCGRKRAGQSPLRRRVPQPQTLILSLSREVQQEAGSWMQGLDAEVVWMV